MAAAAGDDIAQVLGELAAFAGDAPTDVREMVATAAGGGSGINVLAPVADEGDMFYEDDDLNILLDGFLRPRSRLVDALATRFDTLLAQTVRSRPDAVDDAMDLDEPPPPQQQRGMVATAWEKNLDRAAMRAHYEYLSLRAALVTKKNPLVRLTRVQRQTHLVTWLQALQWQQLCERAAADREERMPLEHMPLGLMPFVCKRMPMLAASMRDTPLSACTLQQWDLVLSMLVEQLDAAALFQPGDGLRADFERVWRALWTALVGLISHREPVQPVTPVTSTAAASSTLPVWLAAAAHAWNIPAAGTTATTAAANANGMRGIQAHDMVRLTLTEAAGDGRDVVLGLLASPLPLFTASGQRVRAYALLKAESLYYTYTRRLALLRSIEDETGGVHFQVLDWASVTGAELVTTAAAAMVSLLRRRTQHMGDDGGAAAEHHEAHRRRLVLDVAEHMFTADLPPGGVERYLLMKADLSLQQRNRGKLDAMPRKAYELALRALLPMQPVAADVVQSLPETMARFVTTKSFEQPEAYVEDQIARAVLTSNDRDASEYRRYERIALVYCVTLLDLEALVLHPEETYGDRLHRSDLHGPKGPSDASPAVWIDEYEQYANVPNVTLPSDVRDLLTAGAGNNAGLLRLMRRNFVLLRATADATVARVIEVSSFPLAVAMWYAYRRADECGVPPEFLQLVARLRGDADAAGIPAGGTEARSAETGRIVYH